MYEGGKLISDGNVEDGGGVGGDGVYRGSTEPVLDSLSDSYSDEDSVGNSRSSSCPAYTVY